MRVHHSNFRLNIPNVSGLREIYSHEINVHSIPWTVYVRKETVNHEQWLAIYLRCTKKDMSSKWVHVAAPTFKLVSFTESENTIEIPLMPYVFDAIGMDHGIRMIRWYDLFNVVNGYVKYDTISLDIEIKMADPIEMNQSELLFEEIGKRYEDGSNTKFRLTVTNIDCLMAVQSPIFMLQNTLWHLTINKYPTGRLAIILESMAKSVDFSCKVTVLAKLMKVGMPVEEIQTRHMKYLHRLTVLLVQWDDLLNPRNGFIKNNSIVIEVELNAEKPRSIDSRKRRATTTSSTAKLLKLQCGICFDVFGSQPISFTPCGHMFCSACIRRAIKDRKKCPSCNSRVAVTQVKRAHLPR